MTLTISIGDSVQFITEKAVTRTYIEDLSLDLTKQYQDVQRSFTAPSKADKVLVNGTAQKIEKFNTALQESGLTLEQQNLFYYVLVK